MRGVRGARGCVPSSDLSNNGPLLLKEESLPITQFPTNSGIGSGV